MNRNNTILLVMLALLPAASVSAKDDTAGGNETACDARHNKASGTAAMPLYRDPAAHVDKRVDDLLRRDRMYDERIDFFVASDLRRAVDTCRIIAEPHGKDVITTPLLRERDWGSFTGKYIPSLKDAVWPDDVETLEQIKARAGQFMEWLRAEFPDKVVLAVGHGIINKAIQSVYLDKPMNEVQKMTNAEVRTLTL